MLTNERRLGPGSALRAGSVARYLAVDKAPGEPHRVRHELTDPSIGERFRPGAPLACIAHITDLHVTDVQSPARFEFINREYRDPRFRDLLPMHRPQEALNAHAIAAMVRTLNRTSGPITGRPPSLAIMSGDAVDNAQWNELTAFGSLFEGGRVHVDSGGPKYEGVQAPGWPDDIFWKPDGGSQGEDFMRTAYGYPHAPGLLERALSEFEAEGLKVPWLGCRGNHEEVCQGVGIVTRELAAGMAGFHKPYRMPDNINRDTVVETFVHRPELFMAGPFIPVTPDASRRPFNRTEFVEAHLRPGARPGGHGFTAADRDRGTAFYCYDTTSLRFVVLDTVCHGGGAGGCIDEDQVRWLEACLDEARGRPVVITSHHTLDTLDNVRGDPATSGGRYIGVGELMRRVHGFGNVVLWLNGHIHANSVRARPDARGGGFWEVTTCSLVDWPCQSRLVEIFEAGEGLLGVACTMVDHDGPVEGGLGNGSQGMAGLHRELAGNVPVLGFTSGHEGTASDRNVILPVLSPRRP